MNAQKMASKIRQHSAQPSTIRVIGGVHRGRKLPVILADGLRPTGDRVRETVFNWLQPFITGARCVDVCAGSGALGIEALSRGAASAAFIEFNAHVAQQLRLNCSTLSLEAEVLLGDARRILADQPRNYFDIAFLDPPFDDQLWQVLLQELIPTMKPGGLVYIEQPKSEVVEWPNNWRQLKAKTAGQLSFSLWQLAYSPQSEAESISNNDNE
ncbi:16S rRNA (guanine(966)-N(2))-methyltransferase RsmD [uncultured Umboniibacter sp.]|uniref:16S rRNA (guanine(966)-N(2))-methyltransferase RsmD n=1 Tax=uncultured Umboniibacter sp. TaxID=1798917 RepID=UPI00260DB048|nr:16S rRNA (guanine(966)-N(2))-methyltransferase RsmD [uncultured Umboniibacter sp.]